jgi:glycosyltransferase involved in cell wall biosynthesis
MRVVLADPPAYTPPYDHALAGALARRGVAVELLTSPFRYGEVPAPDGYRLTESLYPASSRLGGSRARLIVKGLEHPLVLARLAGVRADILHLQWLAAPEVDAWLLRSHAPLVFTAHDLLPRRTASRTRTWHRLFTRFDSIVVHSDNGLETLASLGVPRSKLRVISHPVFRRDVARADDGNTVLALGLIRPYKGLGDAVEAVRRHPRARLLVAGDPRESLDSYRMAGGAKIEWRLGYLSEDEIARALAEATVAIFPYRAEIDQSGALLAALGAGLPAVVYDVGGLGEVVGGFGAGRVVRAGDVEALTRALAELLEDDAALEAARAGAERAREELTWDAAAAAHLELYRELA